MLVNNQWVNEDMKEAIKKYLENNENRNKIIKKSLGHSENISMTGLPQET